MPGSEVNLSDCNTVLNTATAKSLKNFADAMEGVPAESFHDAAYDYIRQALTDHQRIIFNGDGYGEEWEAEAARRGLANHRTTPEALRCLASEKTFSLFAEMGVMNEAEILSRYEVKLDKYNKLLNIEANVMIRQSRRMYLPDINNYAGELAGEIYRVREIGGEGAVANQVALLKQLTNGLNDAYNATNELERLHDEASEIEDSQAQASYYADKVIPAMDTLRACIDELECITDHDYWPVPTYNDMLFYV
jgi:glutamine synthetase